MYHFIASPERFKQNIKKVTHKHSAMKALHLIMSCFPYVISCSHSCHHLMILPLMFLPFMTLLFTLLSHTSITHTSHSCAHYPCSFYLRFNQTHCSIILKLSKKHSEMQHHPSKYPSFNEKTAIEKDTIHTK